MAPRTSNAWDATAGGRSPVASELDAIFAALPRPAPAAEPVASARPAGSRRRGLRPWLVFLAAVALTALIGSLAFLMPVARQAPPRPIPPPRSAPPIARPAPVLPAPVAPPTVVPTRIEAKPKPKPAAQQARREPPAPAHHARCSRFATEAWCLRGTIMAADDRLRDAYDAAVRAGVPRDTLVDVRSDWKRLRGRANRDPQALIRGYALLTQELRAEIRRRR
jgi:hypothetical protein